MNPYSNEKRWNFVKGTLPWILWVLLFAVLEYRGVRKGGDEAPPLTYVVRRYVPGWLVGSAIGWLLWHFIKTYDPD